jgi:hypothetical protein
VRKKIQRESLHLSHFPDVQTLHHIYDYWDEHLSHKENRKERCYKFAGIVITSSLGAGIVFGNGHDRYVTIPDRPTCFQKAISFLLVQVKIVEFARREDQWVGYAFSWLNAREVFNW